MNAAPASVASVILPVHNQASHIGQVLESYIDAMQNFPIPYEFVPVVNGPRRDRSLEICKELESKHGCIRTLCIDEGGWGRAVRHGLGEAKGDLLAYTNSARTAPTDLLLLLLYGLAHPGRVIKANRKIRDSVVRRLGSLVYNLECRALFDLPYWDINGTPKVFSRELEGLMAMNSNDDMIDLEFNVICRLNSYPMLEVPILNATRHSGQSTTGLSSAIRMYTGAFRRRRELEPR